MVSRRLRKSRFLEADEVLLVIAVWNQQAFLCGEPWITLPVHLKCRWCREDNARCIFDDFRLNPSADFAKRDILRVILLGHRIAQINDPRLLCKAMQQES